MIMIYVLVLKVVISIDALTLSHLCLLTSVSPYKETKPPLPTYTFLKRQTPALLQLPSRVRQMLENRTKQSRHEMDMIEKLEELKDLNQRQAHVDYESMLQQYSRRQEEDQQRQEAEDEDYIRSELVSVCPHVL